jgi:hypothetical protein
MSPNGTYEEDEIYGPDPDERDVWPFDDVTDILRRDRDEPVVSVHQSPSP